MRPLIGLLGFLLPSSASAEDLLIPSALKHFQAVQVRVLDQVSGGCMPHPERVKEAMELALLRNKIKVSDDAGPILSLTVLGQEVPKSDGQATNYCMILFDVELQSIAIYDDATLWAGDDKTSRVIVWIQSGYGLHRKPMSQKAIEDGATDLANQLSVLWLKAHQE